MSLMSVAQSPHSSCFVLALFAERFGFGKRGERRENQHLARRLSCPNVFRFLPLLVIMFNFASRQGSLANLAEWASASYFLLVPDLTAQSCKDELIYQFLQSLFCIRSTCIRTLKHQQPINHKETRAGDRVVTATESHALIRLSQFHLSQFQYS